MELHQSCEDIFPAKSTRVLVKLARMLSACPRREKCPRKFDLRIVPNYAHYTATVLGEKNLYAVCVCMCVCVCVVLYLLCIK